MTGSGLCQKLNGLGTPPLLAGGPLLLKAGRRLLRHTKDSELWPPGGAAQSHRFLGSRLG